MRIPRAFSLVNNTLCVVHSTEEFSLHKNNNKLCNPGRGELVINSLSYDNKNCLADSGLGIPTVCCV